MSEVKYQGIIDLSVENNSHTIAFNFIKALAKGTALKVLEVGCASAYFGEAVKADGHTVWGIEPDEVAALVAEERVDFVFNGMVEDFINAYPDHKFDVIVFGDVLEHIPYPKEILNKCHQMLTKGGAIVASVPNVAHASVRAMLLSGRWEYAELGILDKTHLRFFTKQTIQELFVEADYQIAAIKAVTLPGEVAVKACKMPVTQTALQTVEKIAKDPFVEDFQYVLVAVPWNSEEGVGGRFLSEQPKVNVLGLANSIESSHAEVRMIEPLRVWAENTGNHARFNNFRHCNQQDIAWADIVILQRHIDISTLNVLHMARTLGKKIVYETDDYLLQLPAHLEHHKASLAAHRKHIHFVLPQVDCVVATTLRLANRYERFNRPIQIIPNCVVDEDQAQLNSANWQEGLASLVVASTDRILVNFVLPAVKYLQSEYGIKLKVIVVGPPGEAFEAAGIIIKRVPNMGYDDFKAYLRTIDNPIGVIPLEESLFSSCKTAIKYFDYSIAGIPTICSDVPPYSDVISNGKDGLLSKNSTEDWVANIERLINDVDLRIELVRSAQKLVSEKYCSKNIVQHYQELFNRLGDEALGKYPKPITPSKRLVLKNKLGFYTAHLLNSQSYRRGISLLRREGPRGIARRLKF